MIIGCGRVLGVAVTVLGLGQWDPCVGTKVKECRKKKGVKCSKFVIQVGCDGHELWLKEKCESDI